MHHAVEHRVDRERAIARVANLHDLSGAAAERAGASGILAVLLAPENERRDRFVHLDRRVANAGGERGRVKAVLSWARSGPAGVKRVHGKGWAALQVVPGHAMSAEKDRVPETGRAFRRDLVRNHLAEASEHDVGKHLTDDVACGHRAGRRRVEDGSHRSGHPDRRKGASVVRNAGADHAAHAETRIGLGVGDRHVDAVARYRRRAVEADRQAGVIDGDGADEIQLPLVAVDPHRVAVGAVGERADFSQHALVRRVDDVSGQVFQIGDSEFVHHADKASPADLVAGSERIEVAFHLDRVADIRAHDLEHERVEFSPLRERQDRDVETLFIDLASVRPEAASTDVGHMGGGGEQGDDAAAAERRGHRREIVEVTGAEPGIVGEKDIAFLHGRERVLREKALHRCGHRVHVPRGAGDGLGEHAPRRVEHPGRDVAGLPGGRTESGPDQSLGLLFHHRQQPVPLDLHPDPV